MMARQSKLAGVFVFILLVSGFVNNIHAKKGGGGRKSSGSSRGSSSSSWGLNSRDSRKQQTNGGSNPGSVGWNVPPKASAPGLDQFSKTSATNVHSGYPSSGTGYHPSGGYGHGSQGAPPPYSQNAPFGHNPPPYGGGGGYGMGSHGYPGGHGYNPGQGYNPSYGGHGSMGHGFGPTIGQQPQTVLLQSQRPGIGQLAKEAFVFAGVSAGVNAAVNRILPGGIYGHSGTGSGGGGSHTQITYNNYYNNGTSAGEPVGVPPAAIPESAAPASSNADQSQSAPQNNNQNSQQAPPNNNNNPQGYITNDEMQKVTEDLYNKDSNNANKYITLNLQGQKQDDNATDDAPDRLLDVKPEAYEMPTVKAVLALHDNYELDVKVKEDVTSDERKEESDLLDSFMSTDVMKSAMKFLANKGFIPDDEYEFKETLKRIWFSQFKRIDGDASSSGFETVFLAEKFDNEIIGLHDWIYYAKQEEQNKINYLGYIKKIDLGDKGALVKVRSTVNDIVQQFTTLFVGTSPELEMALYTICFYTHPNSLCPISLGGSKFMIVSNRVMYYGKDIIIAAFADM